jgi:hypothetical protein
VRTRCASADDCSPSVCARLLRGALRTGRHAAASRHRRGAQQAERDAAHQHDRRHLPRAHLGAALVPPQGGGRARRHAPAHAREPRRVPAHADRGPGVASPGTGDRRGVRGRPDDVRGGAPRHSRASRGAHPSRRRSRSCAGRRRRGARHRQGCPRADPQRDRCPRARRGEIGQVLESARAWHGRLREALAAAKHLAECVAQLTRAEELAKATGATRDAAEAERGAKREALRRAEEDYTRTAGGLADLQQGLEELHRRADAYRQSTRRLREAEESLGGVHIPVPRSASASPALATSWPWSTTSAEIRGRASTTPRHIGRNTPR